MLERLEEFGSHELCYPICRVI